MKVKGNDNFIDEIVDDVYFLVLGLQEFQIFIEEQVIFKCFELELYIVYVIFFKCNERCVLCCKCGLNMFELLIVRVSLLSL